MDKDGINISEEAIDERIARFAEDGVYDGNRTSHYYDENKGDLEHDTDSREHFKHSISFYGHDRQRMHEMQAYFGDSHTKESEDPFTGEPQNGLSSYNKFSMSPFCPDEFKENRKLNADFKSDEIMQYEMSKLKFKESRKLNADFKSDEMMQYEMGKSTFKENRKLNADFRHDEMMQCEMSKLKLDSSKKKDGWSQRKVNIKTSNSVDIDNKFLPIDANLLSYEKGKIFWHPDDSKYVSNNSVGKQKVFLDCEANRVDNILYMVEGTRENNLLKESDYNNITDEPSCSYHDIRYEGQKNNVVYERKNKYCKPSCCHFKMKDYTTSDHERKNLKESISSWDCYGAKPKYQLQNSTKHILPDSSQRNFCNRVLKFESEIDLQEKYDTNKYFKMDDNIINIRRRQIINNQDTTERFVTPIDIDFQRRNGRLDIPTFTMHDARKIAPLVRRHHAENHCTEIRADDFEVINDDSWFENKRKCWTRICWSKTKHSHTYLGSEDRFAIVNSMRSPQHATKAKKRTFSDCCATLWKGASSRLQLWNRTLKKIEGQFGTGVVSYFVFLRWLILLNFVIFLLYLILIILPFSVLSLLPHYNTKLAPNTTLLTPEFLDQFPKNRDVSYSSKRTMLKNISVDLNEDLLSNLGTLLDNYVPNKILDLSVRYDKKNQTGDERYKYSLYCKDRYEKEMANHTNGAFSYFQDFLQGTGWLQSTILFLGFYPDRDVSFFGLPYNLPVSFVAVLLVSFFLSLFLMLQYSSHGIQENMLTRKSSYLTFSNILFCSWDYCIEDKKTAAIRHKSINGEIKSNLTEEHRKLEVSRWSSEKRLKVYLLRIVINILVIAALFGCFYLIYKVVNFQLEKQRQNALKDAGVYTLFVQFLPPLVITGLNILMPVIFYSVVKFEMYATQTQVNIALFRIVFLRLASVFVLVSSLYQQITCEPKDVCKAGMSNFCQSPLCWETYVGQQLYKLVITDFLVYIFMFLGYDLPRDLIVQKCRCKVTEVIGRQVFDIPSQVLSLVYSQTLCWLGLFYSPLLPGISVLKFIIIFYIKKVVVLKHCIPAPVLYKASRSNTIFMTILIISLFFVTVIHGYSLTSIEPSPGCGPFRQYVVMINAVADAIAGWSHSVLSIMTVLFSGFFFIPAFLLLSVIIYYYWTVVVAHRKMIKVLKAQIAIEGRDKQFLLNRLSEAAKQVRTN